MNTISLRRMLCNWLQRSITSLSKLECGFVSIAFPKPHQLFCCTVLLCLLCLCVWIHCVRPSPSTSSHLLKMATSREEGHLTEANMRTRTRTANVDTFTYVYLALATRDANSQQTMTTNMRDKTASQFIHRIRELCNQGDARYENQLVQTPHISASTNTASTQEPVSSMEEQEPVSSVEEWIDKPIVEYHLCNMYAKCTKEQHYQRRNKSFTWLVKQIGHHFNITKSTLSDLNSMLWYIGISYNTIRTHFSKNGERK